MIKIAVQGITGRMGFALRECVHKRSDCQIVAGVDISREIQGIPLYSEITLLKESFDVLIDFSVPAAADKALDYCALQGLPCVICTTGLTENTQNKLQSAAQKTAVFCSSNMSLGINLLVQLVKRAQVALAGFDIEIIEKHHRGKLDAPSGTALMLADAIKQQAGGQYEYVYGRQGMQKRRSDSEIGIHAIRGGSIVGEHEVLFSGPDETITFSHAAHSRGVFASGALAAAMWLIGKKPGLYSMQNLMEAL